MKCKIIRSDMAVSVPGGVNALPPELQEQIEVREVVANGRKQARAFWKLGAILPYDDCWRLVQQGCALPADDECAKAANRTPLQLAAAQAAYERLTRGIAPEDFDLYNAGVITGYQPDADEDDPPEKFYKPGPNWDRYYEMRAEIEDDDEDDGA